MKHIAKIMIEFAKYALNSCDSDEWWNKLTLEQQEEYLNEHKNTEKRITARNLITYIGKKNAQLKDAEKHIAEVLKDIMQDTNLVDQITLMKNVDDLSFSMQNDVDDITRKMRDLTQSKSNNIKEKARLEQAKTKNREKFNQELDRAKLFDELYNKFLFITRRKPKIDLNTNILDTKTGHLPLQKAIVKHLDRLQKVIYEWKSATKGISDKKDFIRLLGLSKS